MNLQLRKFKPENMADDKVCVFIGKRNTGKSTLVTDILYHTSFYEWSSLEDIFHVNYAVLYGSTTCTQGKY